MNRNEEASEVLVRTFPKPREADHVLNGKFVGRTCASSLSVESQKEAFLYRSTDANVAQANKRRPS
jgi:hypothetical protein